MTAFGGQQFSKCPDMIRDSSRHRWSSRLPFLLKPLRGFTEWFTQTQMRPRHGVKCVKEAGLLLKMGPVFPETR